MSTLTQWRCADRHSTAEVDATIYLIYFTVILYLKHSSKDRPPCGLLLLHLKPNTHRRRRRDATVELSLVGGVYWALLSEQLSISSVAGVIDAGGHCVAGNSSSSVSIPSALDAADRSKGQPLDQRACS